MKTNKKRLGIRIATIIATLVCCVFAVVAIRFANHYPSDDNDKTYERLTTYDLTDVIPESYHIYTSNGDGTYKFEGLNAVPSSGTTLVIKDQLLISGAYYPVTKVGPLNSVTTVAGIQFYNVGNVSGIKAVVVPDTVTEIEDAAFYGYASLEYLKTPLIGNVIDSLNAEDSGAIIQDDCFGSMFSNNVQDNSLDLNLGRRNSYAYVDASGNQVYDANGNAIVSTPVLWYDSKITQTHAYQVPYNLQEVIITKETRLCNRAFMDFKSIVKISLPESCVDLTAQYIFTACTNLETINLPSKVKNLGLGMFAQCSSLGKTTNPNGIDTSYSSNEVGYYENEFVIPSGVTTISEGMFYDCKSLMNISIPSGLKQIHAGAFYGCTSLRNMNVTNSVGKYLTGKSGGFNLPESIVRIGMSAFRNNYSWKEITIPAKSLERIERAAFSGCIGLEYLEIPFVGQTRGDEKTAESCFGYIFGSGFDKWWFGYENNPTEEGDTVVGGDITAATGYLAAQYYDAANNKFSNFRIPESLRTIRITDETIIGEGALQELASVETLTLNEGITRIHTGALKGKNSQGASSYQTSLIDLTIPFARTHNGSEWVNNFGSLFGTISYPGSYEALQGKVKYYIPETLKRVTISNQPTVYTGTFHNCYLIESVTIDDSTETIQEAIFYNNQALTNLCVPFIGTIRGNYNQIYWWYGPTYYMHNSLAILFSTTKSGSSEYRVGYSNWGGFYERYIPFNLKTVRVTDDTEICASALRYFNSLTSVTIEDSVQIINQGALGGCGNLETLYLPFVGKDINTTKLHDSSHVFGWAFGNLGYSSSLETVYGYSCDPNLWYVVDQGYATYKIPKSLVSVAFSEDVNSITNYAFANCSSLEVVSFDKTEISGAPIQTMGAYAFYNCSNLTALYAKKSSYMAVGDYAFFGCSKIYNLDDFLSPYVTKVGNYSFGRTSVASIDFSKYEYIGNYAFMDCIQLTTADIPLSVDFLGEGVFSGCLALTSAELAEGKVSNYLFKNCANLVSIDLTGVTKAIPTGMFYGCTSLNYVNSYGNGDGLILDLNTVVIGDYAFAECSSFDNFLITTDITTIGKYAFANTALTELIIPRQTTNLGGHICHGIDPATFKFWVYIPDTEWPETWDKEWHCELPVFVVGDVSDDIFTYEYSIELKGYIITGLEEGKYLTDFVKFPTAHFGLPIRGINNNGDIPINTQTSLSTVVLPSNYITIADDVFNVASTNGTPKEIFVYYDVNDSVAQNNLGLPQDWIRWIPYGMVFTNEYWEYGITTNTSAYPYLNLENFEVTIYNSENVYIEYDGTAKIVDVERVKSPGYEYGYGSDSNGYSKNLLKNFYEDDLDLFTITYKDNIVVSNDAKVLLSVNSSSLASLNAERTTAKKTFLRMTGTATVNFTINKKRITIYPTQSVAGVSTGFISNMEYNINFWSNSEWGTTNIQGLEGTDFIFSGKLCTNGMDAGVYKAKYDESTKSYINGVNDFFWQSPYRIYLNGRNVTDNFLVVIGDLTVNILRKDITILWTGGKWDDENNPRYYLYGYNGSVITPTAVAVGFYNDSATTSVPNPDDVIPAQLEVKNKSESSTSGVGVYPNWNNGSPTSSAYVAVATLLDNKNYRLVNKDRSPIIYNGLDFDPSLGGNSWSLETEYRHLEQEYYISKADVIISITNNDWVIGKDDKYWMINDWSSYQGMFGLGSNSYIKGVLRSHDKENNATYSNDAIDANYRIYWDPTCKIESTNTPGKMLDFQIYNDYLNIEENDFYNVTLDVTITIRYNNFEVQYTITDDSGVPIPQDYSTVQDSNAEGQLIHKIIYTTAGGAHTFAVNITNPELTDDENYSIYYYYGDGSLQGSVPMTFTAIDTYRIRVEISRENFNPYAWNIELVVKRSDVKVAEDFSKQYDGEPHNIYDYIIKKDTTQEVTAVYYDATNPSNLVPLSTPPLVIGSYAVLLTIKYPNTNIDNSNLGNMHYFNNYEELHFFEITPRQIIVNVDGSKTYDGQYVEIAINDIPNLSTYMLPDDIPSGRIRTISPEPGSYVGGLSHWEWTQQFAVFNLDGSVTTKNYEIVFEGTYEIELMKFTDIIVTNVDTVYDGNPHFVTIVVVDAPLDAVIKYNGQLTNPGYINASDTPYDVNYEISALHYETVTGTAHVKIDYATIKYKLRGENTVYEQAATIVAPSVFYDESYHRVAIDPVTPWIAQVEYEYSMLPDGQGGNAQKTFVEPYLKEHGTYTINFTITAENYTDVSGTIIFTISTDNLKKLNLSDLIITSPIYDYDPVYETERTISVSLSPTVLYTGYCRFYYSLTGAENDWSETPIMFSQAGVYTIYIKALVYGYWPYPMENDSPAYGTLTINALPLDGYGVSVSDYVGIFDGEYHSIKVNNLGLTDNPADVNNLPDNLKDPIKLWNLEYTTNPDVYNYKLEQGWSTERPEYKDAGTYSVYVRLSAPNYIPVYLEGTVTIHVAELYGTVELDLNKFQYSAKPLNSSQIFVSDMSSFGVITKKDGESVATVHDGRRIYYFFAASRDASGNLVKDTENYISNPTELGLYYVEIQFLPTPNCVRMTVEGYIEIVPRILEVQWDKEFEYDGLEHAPNPYVETGTGDRIVILCYPQFSGAAIEIGTYVYNLEMYMITGSSQNYQLDNSTIEMNIIRRNVKFIIDELDVPYAGDDVSWSLISSDIVTDLETIDNKYDEDVQNLFLEGTFLLNLGHKLKLDISTASGIRQAYVYLSGQLASIPPQNRINVNSWSVVDANGNDVSHYYNVTFDMIVYIDYQPIEVDLYDYHVTYDGYAHTIYENEPNGVISLIEDQENIRILGVFYSEDINCSDEDWLPLEISKTNVGVYEIAIYIIALYHPAFKAYAKLIIDPCDLDVTVTPDQLMDDCYDAVEHKVSWKVNNLDNFDDQPIIRYYPAEDYSDTELYDFYMNSFNINNPLFKEGLETYCDAGKYYAAIYFPQPPTHNWNKYVEIFEIEVAPRPLRIKFFDENHNYYTEANPLTFTTTYNKYKYSITLGTHSEIVESDLLDGHYYYPGQLKDSSVQTISADAGWYLGSDGFEFKNMIIYDANSNNLSKNYKPILQYINVEIQKADIIPGNNFYAEDITKQYDGMLNCPTIYTDSDGALFFEFYEVREDGSIGVFLGNDVRDAGYYYVICKIGEGKNYFGYNGIGVTAYVLCEKRRVAITWENLVQEFNNQELKPTPYIYDVEENRWDMDYLIYEYFFDGTLKTSKSKRLAGEYIVLASFPVSFADQYNYDIEYNINNYQQIFEIKKAHFYIKIDDIWYTSNDPWSKEITADDIPELAALADVANSGSIILQQDLYGQVDKSFPAMVYTVSGEPGYYNEDFYFEWDYAVYSEILDAEKPVYTDITNSIILHVDGKVTIYSNQIEFIAKDFEVTYTGRAHDIWTGITMINPVTTDDLTILYKEVDENGNINWVSNPPQHVNVGEYLVEFRITSPGFESIEGSIKMTIVQAEAFIIFTKPIDKVYNGLPVDKDSVYFTGGWNDTTNKEDLIFTFKEVGSNVPLEKGPIDVGEYEVEITCKKDLENKANGVIGNYTELSATKKFKITEKTLDLTLELDKEIECQNDLGGIDVHSASMINHIDLQGQDKLSYVLTVSNFKHGEVNVLSKVTAGSGSVIVDGYKVVYSNVIYDDGDAYTISLEWYMQNPVRLVLHSDGTNQPMMVSDNYIINLDLTYWVHYELMDIDVKDVVTDFDGNAHSAVIDDTITINNPQNQYTGINGQYKDIVMKFSDTGVGTYTTADLTQITPVIDRVIFYEFVMNDTILADPSAKQYEPYKGSYKLTVKFLKRTITDIVYYYDKDGNSTTTKTYDGIPFGALVTQSIAGELREQYLPLSYNVVLEEVPGMGTLQDYSASEIQNLMAVSYRKSGYNTKLVKAVDAGNYYYTITIPASTYYAETVYTSRSPITIERAIIYIANNVDDGFVKGYNGEKITFESFDATDSPYDLYLLDKDGNKISLPNSMSIHGTLMTNYSSIGTYVGSSSTSSTQVLKWKNSNYLVRENGEDVTINYSCDISKATMTIIPGTMDYETRFHEVEYNGRYYYPGVTNATQGTGIQVSSTGLILPMVIMKQPIAVDTVEYSFYPDKEFSQDITTVGCLDQNTHHIYLKLKARNYNDEIVKVTIIITKAKTNLTIPDLSRDYDANEVLYPMWDENNDGVVDSTWTNNNETPMTSYIYAYEKFDGVNFISMGDDRPIDVGLYRITVRIPASQNYLFVEATAEFTINPREVNVNWTDNEFTYNGLPQAPVANIATLKNETLKVAYTYEKVTPFGLQSLGSIKPTDAGVYTVKVTIDEPSPNYCIPAYQSQLAFTIKQRSVTVSINSSRYFNAAGLIFTYDPSGVAYDKYFVAPLVAGHDLPTSFIKTIDPSVGIYENFNNFTWINAIGQEIGGPIILDEFGNDVSNNYVFTYNVSLIITYSKVEYEVEDVNVEYDGQEHSIKVNVKNLSGQPVEVRYSTIFSTNSNNYSLTNPTFVDVTWDPNNPTEVGTRIVYFVIITQILDEVTGVFKPTEQFGQGYVRITQIESDLHLVNPNQNLNKVYDGVSVENPEVTYAGSDAVPRNVRYTYYFIDSVTGIMDDKPLVHNPINAGTYKLVISIPSNGNYAASNIEMTFTIDKREIVITTGKKEYKQYNLADLGWSWKIPEEYSVGLSETDGLVSGEKFFGTIQTVTQDARNYFASTTSDAMTDFAWQTTPYIINAAGDYTTDNYTIFVKLDVTITPGEIIVEWSGYNSVFDNKPHTITVNVLMPYSYKILYSSDGINYSETPIYRTAVGETPVYFKVEAPNYQTYDNRLAAVIIYGLPIPESGVTDEKENRLEDLQVYLDDVYTPTDPVFDPDCEGVYKIENIDPSTQKVKFVYAPKSTLAKVTGTCDGASVDLSQPYPLDFYTKNEYLFKLIVEADNGDIKIYQVLLTTGTKTLDGDNSIIDISVFDTVDITHSTDLFVDFNPTNYGPYTIEVPVSVTSVEFEVTPNSPKAYVSIANSTVMSKIIQIDPAYLTEVKIICTAENTTKGTPYVVYIGHPGALPPTAYDSDENRLMDLKVLIDGVDTSYTPSFNSDNKGVYKVENVPTSALEVEFDVTTLSTLATVSGVGPFALTLATTPIQKFDITVTSESGKVMVYSVWISASSFVLSNDSSITDIKGYASTDIGQNDNLVKNFDETNYGEYELVIPDTATGATIVVSPSDADAKVSINGTIVKSLFIDVANNSVVDVEVICEAPDGTSGNPYKLKIRHESTNPNSAIVNIDGLVFAPTQIYNGQPYMGNNEPYFDKIDTNYQTITYYLGSDVTYSNPIAKPADVGNYTFKIDIASDGVYQATTIKQSFAIDPKEVELVWDKLTQTYNGSELSPTAYYLDIDDNKVNCIVSPPQSAAGTYTAIATQDPSSLNFKNYKIIDPQEEWTIEKKKIDQVMILPDLSFGFGEDIVIKDVNGNTYEVSPDGILTIIPPASTNSLRFAKRSGTEVTPLPYKLVVDPDKNANGVTNYDPINNPYGKHYIYVELIDTANTEWNGKGNSDKLVYTFDITPMELPSATLDIKLNYVYQHVVNADGSAITPTIGANIIKIEDNSVEKELTLAIDLSTPLDEGYTVTYDDTTNSVIGKSNFVVKGLGHADYHQTADGNTWYKGNYSFEITKDFEIVAALPTVISLKSDALISFIDATYDASTNETIIIEDGSPKRTTPNQQNQYLGHLHQDTLISDILNQLSNDLNYIKVYDANGNEYDSSQYNSRYFGTGCSIALFDEDFNEIDRIYSVLYGDTSGDGLINVNDKLQFVKVLSEGLLYDNYVSEDKEYIWYSLFTQRTQKIVNVNLVAKINIYLKNSEDFNANFLTN